MLLLHTRFLSTTVNKSNGKVRTGVVGKEERKTYCPNKQVCNTVHSAFPAHMFSKVVPGMCLCTTYPLVVSQDGLQQPQGAAEYYEL